MLAIEEVEPDKSGDPGFRAIIFDVDQDTGYRSVAHIVEAGAAYWAVDMALSMSGLWQKDVGVEVEIHLSIYMTLMLGSKTTEKKAIAAPKLTNKMRAKKGKPLMPAHTVVRIVPWKYISESQQVAGRTHARPRLHWRRSHLRVYDLICACTTSSARVRPSDTQQHVRGGQGVVRCHPSLLGQCRGAIAGRGQSLNTSWVRRWRRHEQIHVSG